MRTPMPPAAASIPSYTSYSHGPDAGMWRRKRDSNPRTSFPVNGFQDRRYQPLTHSSGIPIINVRLGHAPDVYNRDAGGMGESIEFAAEVFQRSHDFVVLLF